MLAGCASSRHVSSAPVSERKVKETILSGQVRIESPLAVVPARVDVRLMQDEREIALTNTDKAGVFYLQGDFPNGDYTIEARSGSFRGEIDVEINSYKIEGLHLLLKKR